MADPEGDQPPPAPEPVEPVALVQDTPALYLARCMVADLGFVPGHVPEAAPLAEVSDVVLTGGDGVGLVIKCILDRDRDPERRFTIEHARLDEIAAACRKHAGSMHGVREGVAIEIWEIGAGVPDAQDRMRLEGYTFRKITQKGVQVRTYAVNTAPDGLGDLVSTAADGSRQQPWIRRILKEPRRSREQLAEAARQHEKVARFHKKPVATAALLAAFAAMFVLSLVWTVMPNDGLSPGLGTLISLGALDHGRFEEGEWWRMLTCAFLHGGLMHLVFNSVAMYMAGGVLENLVGRAWMLALFVIGALGGSAASMAINPAHIASVGASGAIMGLLAAAMVASLRLPRGQARTQILASLGYILVPSLLPLATRGADNTDYAAHLGGAVAGAVAGAILYLTWPREAETPRLPRLAAAIAALGFLATGYGFLQAASDHAMYEQAFASFEHRNELIPDGKAPTTDAEIEAQLPRLLTTYPRDPRVQFWAGFFALKNNDLDGAISHFERCLADRDTLALLIQAKQFEVNVRYYLAHSYEAKDDPGARDKALAPSCSAGTSAADFEVRAYFRQHCP